jgi:putative hydrolase of the HAD superfamily
MIRNIVFDLGNVLLNFRPADYLESKNYPEEIRTLMLKDIFGSIEWLLIDDGKLSVPDAIDLISGNSSLSRAEIVSLFDKRTEMLSPIGGNIKLLPGLKEAGFKLYFLSNFPLDIFEEVKNSNSFFRYFEGGLISAAAGCSKPHREIYDMLIRKYDLKPSECLYVDDLAPNVGTAVSLGMKGLITSGSHDITDMLAESLYSVEGGKE